MSKNRKSTSSGRQGGPKTAEGKARSALNNLKHGRFSRHGSLLKYECDRVFLDTYRHLLAAWAPANRFEANLVQQLAHIEWSLFRCRALETSLLESAFNRQDNSLLRSPQPLDPAIAASDLPPRSPFTPSTSIENCPPNLQPIHSKQETSVRTPIRTPLEPRANPFRTPSEPRANPIRTPFGLPRTRLRTPEPHP
ncbi:MAG: hypothetical protein M9913_09990 [Bryobacteraceae bacterium]|nr:hypothetical protein [Bryobacteraceae bacterium]